MSVARCIRKTNQVPDQPDLRATGARYMHNTIPSSRWLSSTAALVLLLGLPACEQLEAMDIQNPFEGFFDSADNGAEAALPVAASGDVETRDVEAPDVFQKTEAGLWDGRPSLGGVWVAHPDVVDPERVIIRNEDNGRFIVGALFRRERENPGPALQVSSDAAEELGMVAGTPANLDVVALRREEVAATPPPATTDFDAVGDVAPSTDLSGPADVTATPLDPIAGAAAAVSAAESAAGAAADTAVAAVAPPAPPVIETTDTAADVTSTLPPLNALTSEPPVPAAPIAAAEPTVAPIAAPLVTSSLEKPFIQIGIFSVESNAENTAGTLRGDGMSARVLKQESQGTTFWRVLVGPAPNAQDRTAVLAKVQALGFNDAYFVTN